MKRGLALTLVFTLAIVSGAIFVMKALLGPSAEESIQRLPRDAAALVRDGKVNDALGFLAEGGRVNGMSGQELLAAWHYGARFQSFHPHIAAVETRQDDEGNDERKVVIVGLDAPTNLESATAKDLSPFRVTATLIQERGEWKVKDARAEFERR